MFIQREMFFVKHMLDNDTNKICQRKDGLIKNVKKLESTLMRLDIDKDNENAQNYLHACPTLV